MPFRLVLFDQNWLERFGWTTLEEERFRVVIPELKGRLLDIGAGPNRLVKQYGDGIGVDVFDWGGGVMVVEDNPLVRESCVLRLEASGFSASGVGDGVEALAELAKAQSQGAPVQAVLLDVDLPGKNGVAVAREMRKQIPNLPVIYITGNMQNQALRGIRGEPVLAKPLEFAELFSTLNGALNQH